RSQIEAQQDQQDQALEMQQEQMRQQAENERTNVEVQSRISMNNEDNRTAMELALLDIEHGGSVETAKNPNANPTP
ncbi:MAG: hypothetical protein ACK5X3_02165, partial [Pseudomonadota bacterium]